MPQKPKLPADPNRRAKVITDLVEAMLDETPATKDPGRVARGRVSGAKGGKVRASRLTPEQRSEIARKAAAKRWSIG